MARSLRRRVIRTATQCPGGANVVVHFAPDAFAVAPEWSPGEEFIPAIDFLSWYRRDSEDLVTAVVANVSRDGSSGSHEVWTVELDMTSEGGRFLFEDLWDKPRRVLCLENVESRTGYGASRVVSRERQDGHPMAAVATYWRDFHDEHGFTPKHAHLYGVADGYWVAMSWCADEGVEELDVLLRAVRILSSRWRVSTEVGALDKATLRDPCSTAYFIAVAAGRGRE